MILTKIFQKNIMFFFTVFITGIIGTFSFSPYDFWPAAIISLAALQIFTINCKTNKAAIIGFIWGIGFFGSGINWLFVSISSFGKMPFLVNVLILFMFIIYLSIYPSIFITILNVLCPNLTIYRLVFASPAIWHITEFLRGNILTGFPWLQFGYSQIDGPLKGLAPIAGVESITFFIVIIVGLLTHSYLKRNFFSLFAVFLILIIIWPLSYINWYKPLSELKVKISLIQGNISQKLKWNHKNLSNILNIYLSLSNPLINKSIIIWPESAISDLEINQQILLNKLDNLLRSLKINLITGIIDLNIDKKNKLKMYNSIIVLGDNNYPYLFNNSNRYRKYHLVPFGEFIPFKKILKPLSVFFNIPISSFNEGAYKQKSLHVSKYVLTSIICYEIIFGEQVRINFQPKTNFLLAISNNAWFGNSIGPWQHFQMGRMRALELGRPLLHCTNNGITAIVNSNGNIQSMLIPFKKGVLNKIVVPTKGITPYSKLGIKPIWIITLISIMIACYNRKIK